MISRSMTTMNNDNWTRTDNHVLSDSSAITEEGVWISSTYVKEGALMEIYINGVFSDVVITDISCVEVPETEKEREKRLQALCTKSVQRVQFPIMSRMLELQKPVLKQQPMFKRFNNRNSR